jgi:putative holliday junction resolvase
MRYLAVDLGDARTGLAVGDDLTRIVSPLDVVECPTALCGGEALLDLIVKALDRVASPRAACEIVVGLPMNMDGTEGPRAKIVRAFADRLAARTGRRVHLQDERLTSSDADWSMARSGLTRKEKKQRRDALAAAAILRDFLGAGNAGAPINDDPDDDPSDER